MSKYFHPLSNTSGSNKLKKPSFLMTLVKCLSVEKEKHSFYFYIYFLSVIVLVFFVCVLVFKSFIWKYAAFFRTLSLQGTVRQYFWTQVLFYQTPTFELLELVQHQIWWRMWDVLHLTLAELYHDQTLMKHFFPLCSPGWSPVWQLYWVRWMIAIILHT